MGAVLFARLEQCGSQLGSQNPQLGERGGGELLGTCMDET